MRWSKPSVANILCAIRMPRPIGRQCFKDARLLLGDPRIDVILHLIACLARVVRVAQSHQIDSATTKVRAQVCRVYVVNLPARLDQTGCATPTAAWLLAEHLGAELCPPGAIVEPPAAGSLPPLGVGLARVSFASPAVMRRERAARHHAGAHQLCTARRETVSAMSPGKCASVTPRDSSFV